ncbi:hypothetical protein RclHR1_00070066 [Rhizophagus clarus]|uniref:F-box domain-containing protein n=1 Tax=Rhizophagus clarus TaxID=94130 RepID=A0A2Z6SKB3_9GLOM|nr:hypothetical protein RclHR1_00070066 [Rhizophagus clarus]GES74360.1 hypothetical protein GLOIN_2v1782082 [Rhizophagus clarus]
MTNFNSDCLRIIFDLLRTDRKSLRSCLLVNKEWFHLIAPMLWKRCSWHFHRIESEKNLINTILSCLPTSSKKLLSDNNVKLPLKVLLKSPFFNYISFCKFIDFEIIERIIWMVFDDEEYFNSEIYIPKTYEKIYPRIYRGINTEIYEGINTIINEEFNTGIDEEINTEINEEINTIINEEFNTGIDEEINTEINEEINIGTDDEIDTETCVERNLLEKNLLRQEIYKLFVSQCKNIEELSWEEPQPLTLFPGASTCFPRLHSLSIRADPVSSEALYEMAKICKCLKILTIYEYSQENYGLISLIDAQENLKEVSIYPNNNRNDCKELIKALERKGDTITNLRLCSFSIMLPSLLTSLINLKIGNYCADETDADKFKKFQQHLTVSEFPNLQVLHTKELTCFKELSMLIEKTRGNIIKVSVDLAYKTAEDTGMLIKAIAKYCPKIEKLSTCIEPNDFVHVKSLLLNCTNISSIVLDSFKFSESNNGDMLLDIISRFAPESLVDISISGNWNYSINALESFLESFRERTLNHFEIIDHHTGNVTDRHRLTVSRYVFEGVITDSDGVW